MVIPSDLAVPDTGTGSNAIIDLRKDIVSQGEASSRIMEIRDALLYENEEYRANKEKWKKYSDCYDAEDIAKYIYPHSRESEDIFRQRVKRGYYYNYTASVIDLFVSYLFHAPITRTIPVDEVPDLDEFMKDCNLGGDSYHIFKQMESTFAQLHGHVGVLVDTPKLPNGEPYASEEDRKKAGHRPYLCLVQALQILDWEVDEFGKLDWVKIEVAPDYARGWTESARTDIRQFVIWTKDKWEEWQVIENDAKMLGSDVNKLGEVPLVIVRNERKTKHPLFGNSAVRDIADINIAILNWSSLGDEEIFQRCINVLCLNGDGQSTEAVKISHQNVLEYREGSEAPFYLSPGETPLELISGWIERAKDEIYRLAKLGGSTGVEGTREATSGIAYAFEFNETNQSLAKKAESLEQGENEIFRLVAKWYGKEWTGSVSYPREFGVEDFTTDLMLLSEARTTLTSDTAVKELEIKIAMKLFSRASQELRDKIKKEIEAGDPRGLDLLASFAEAQKPADSARSSGQNNRDKGSASGKSSEKEGKK